MCGIAGWIDTGGGRIDPQALDRMTDALSARGPDGRGTWTSADGSVGFGHRRLSILDLTPMGAQPFRDEERGLTLTYNGEIYNHPELKRELQAKGYMFRSRCDSETLLHAYAEWGEDCLDRLIGIFAFAIWDEGQRKLFCARDQIGVKPFVYAQSGNRFLFGSQLKAILASGQDVGRLSHERLAQWLLYGVPTGSEGLIDGIETLPPATALTLEDGKVSTRRYWSLPEETSITDRAAAKEAIEDAVERAVKRQLLSDVPVCSFLSGGIDSSLVTAIATEANGEPVTSFTIGFDTPKSDERAYAKRAAEHTGARQIIEVLTPENADALLDEAVEVYDDPFGIPSALPMIAVARLAGQHGTKVVLTGDGADELFAGYRHYDALSEHFREHGRTSLDCELSVGRRVVSRLAHGTFSPFSHYQAHNGPVGMEGLKLLSGPALETLQVCREREREHFPSSRAPVDAARRCDMATYLPDEILVKVDRATMAYGIEARVPLLDTELVQLAFSIDPALHVTNGRKSLLKEAAARWLPDDILSTRKKGFSPPLGPWITDRPDAWDRLTSEVAGGSLVSNGLIDPFALSDNLSKLPRSGAALLQLVLLERWVQRWGIS
ncbi:asparagine synthase (glutamine-hydrolyzing) [Parvularcula sp. ZS-1/3]|uniref:asparagine synthase (glutamine-hydrolyzing) n=1 Tax=Parvularcula mediterranea TaxID=2732508 RepID=A0A7Y3RMJ2_9PROT|nr:asparagine synthase (glutamine-hydrolyzing) [Parvularcula mediterranea]NNU16847.1 asparagine synthase (glutamine-hydrolyzing) [Parvularcula mediterranea]